MISQPYGQLYQVVATQSTACQEPASSGSKGRWVFCQDMTPVIPDERTVILALQVATDLAEEDIAVLDEVVNATRVGSVGERSETWAEEYSCRTWVKDALENLRLVTKSGVVSILPDDCDVASMSREAVSLAKSCMRSGERRLLASKILDNGIAMRASHLFVPAGIRMRADTDGHAVQVAS